MPILDLLARVFPDRPFQKARFLGAGLDSQTFLVDDQYVFRFPKREEVARNLAKEIALLPHLQDLPLQIPCFQFTGIHPENGLPFVGYPILKGTEGDITVFQRQTPEQQEQTLAAIGNFLTQLHAFQAERALQLGVELLDSRQDYQDAYQEIQTTLLPVLTLRQQRQVSQRFDAFLSDSRHFTDTNCLIHDDFSADHILCNPETGIPQGVIDFGDVAVGDPDLDLKYLYAEYGPEFIDRLLATGHYQTPTEPVILTKKLKFFNFFEAVMDVLDLYTGNSSQVRATLNLLLAKE
ncbi:phosphotransferase family protein [Larkinella harenae]